MEINSLHSASLLSEVKITWRVLGTEDFYHELFKLNNLSKESNSTQTNTKKIYEQIFLFLSTNNELVLEEKLINIRQNFIEKKQDKIFKTVIDSVANEMKVSNSAILERKNHQKNTSLKTSKLVFFSVLSNYYLMSQTQIVKLINNAISQSQVSRYITEFNNLELNQSENLQTINTYNKIIESLKTSSHE
jgi:hypothetical protein